MECHVGGYQVGIGENWDGFLALAAGLGAHLRWCVRRARSISGSAQQRIFEIEESVQSSRNDGCTLTDGAQLLSAAPICVLDGMESTLDTHRSSTLSCPAAVQA